MNHRDRDPRDRINKNERRYNNDQDKRSRSKSPSNQSRTNSRDLITTNSKDNNRWDDPMKQFSEKHKPEKSAKHRAPPNRFDILPGRQWDGIDRSNGFEVAYFKKLAGQGRKKDLDYKYSVADM